MVQDILRRVWDFLIHPHGLSVTLEVAETALGAGGSLQIQRVEGKGGKPEKWHLTNEYLSVLYWRADGYDSENLQYFVGRFTGGHDVFFVNGEVVGFRLVHGYLMMPREAMSHQDKIRARKVLDACRKAVGQA